MTIWEMYTISYLGSIYWVDMGGCRVVSSLRRPDQVDRGPRWGVNYQLDSGNFISDHQHPIQKLFKI